MADTPTHTDGGYAIWDAECPECGENRRAGGDSICAECAFRHWEEGTYG